MSGKDSEGVWCDHFRSLSERRREEEGFDREFANGVEEKVERERETEEARRGEDSIEEEGEDRVVRALAVLNREVTAAEVERIVKKMKNRKAAGADGFVAELLKNGGESMIVLLTMLIVTLFDCERVPKEWGQGDIAPLYKGGSRREASNYRGITLISVLAKLYATVLEERVRDFMEETQGLCDEQGGFRRERGCPEQIFCLREIVRNAEGPIVCVFIDVAKAYDRTFREGVWHRMKDSGISGKMWRVIVKYYDKIESCVRVGSKRSAFFAVEEGLRQGCPLSPVLFNVFIDGLVRDLRRCGVGVRVPGREEPVSSLLFADDIALLATTVEDIQTLVNVTHEYFRKWRLRINVGKTKSMFFRAQQLRRGGERVPLPPSDPSCRCTNSVSLPMPSVWTTRTRAE